MNNKETREERRTFLGQSMLYSMIIGTLGTSVFGFNLLFTAVLLIGIGLFAYLTYDCVIKDDKDED